MIALALLAASGELLPLEPGREWTFHGHVGGTFDDAEGDFTVRVERDPNDRLVLRGAAFGIWGLPLIAEPEGEWADFVEASERGVSIEGVLSPVGPPQTAENWLWLPAFEREGQDWAGDVEMEQMRVEFGGRYGLVEQLTVQAGTFTCRRVDWWLVAQGDERYSGSLWLAPEVGPVRIEWRTGEWDLQAELKEYAEPQAEG